MTDVTKLDPSATNGWDPYIPETPQTPFSKQLLKSIPKKVCAWLQLLGQEASGEYGLLKWNFTPENGTIIYEGVDSKFFQVWWNTDTDFVQATDSRVRHLETNLDFFVRVEQMIYDELLRLQLEIYERTAPERFLSQIAPIRADEPDAFEADLERSLSSSAADLVQSEDSSD